MQNIPRLSRRMGQISLLNKRIAELEGQLADKDNLVSALISSKNEEARKNLFQKNGLLNYLCFCRPNGSRCAVLQISITAKGLPRIRTGLSLDGKDFRTVYARAVQLLAEAFEVQDDADLVRDMLATCDSFLAAKQLRLVTVSYEQVVPND